MPIWRRCCSSAAFPKWAIFFPLKRISPPVGNCSRKNSFISVLLPAPLGPTKNTNSPGSIRSEISANAGRSPPGYIFVTALHSIKLPHPFLRKPLLQVSTYHPIILLTTAYCPKNQYLFPVSSMLQSACSLLPVRQN